MFGSTGVAKQQFEFHSAPVLDVDWRDEESFATCSTDKLIHYCRIGEEKPLRTFAGHEDEVNAIKWSPNGDFLASCSDDFTCKIWSPSSLRCIHDFNEHEKEVYTLAWSPTGPGTAHPNEKLVLATASFDGTVKIWDIDSGKCLYTLTRHEDAVYAVSFSPDGKHLASGSIDSCIHIWKVKDGSLVKTYKGGGGIFAVSWNAAGDKVAACFGLPSNYVCVIDFQ